MESISAEMLIDHFEERIRDVDRRARNLDHGKIPRFPQLTLFLGDAAKHGYSIVSSGLFAAWPQFQDELCLLGLGIHDNGFEFQRLSVADAPESMQLEEFEAELANLFGEHVHFQDMGLLNIYYLLETSAIRSIEELESWLYAMKLAKTQTSLNDIPCNEVLFLLLDESFVHRKMAKELAQWLSQNEDKYQDYTVVLLSNKRSDGRILRSWDTCYRVATASMLVSNNRDRAAAGVLTGKGLLTARYTREDKPLADIGQVVVEGMINQFRESVDAKTQVKLTDEQLIRRLGITKRGTLSIVDSYVEDVVTPRLPSEEELEYYPRLDDYEYGALSQLSAQEFDGLTMGTWTFVVKSLVAEITESLRDSIQVRNQWSEQYGRYLRNTFTPLELITLKNYIDQVKDLMSSASGVMVREGRVLDSAVLELQVALSSDKEIIEMFCDAIEQQAEHADSYFTAFNQLVKSLGYLHDLSDATIAPFYSSRVIDYFNNEGDELFKQFWALSGRDELYDFLCGVIDDIIGSDPIFIAPFEEEIESRLGDDFRGKETRNFMRRRLLGEGVPQYLQTSFNLGDPLIGAILLKTGTELHKSLESTPGDQSYYYNIGYGNAAERLELYSIDPTIIGG